MKQQWWAYAVVGILSIGAGVVIAGLPDDVPVDATIDPPNVTVAPESTLAGGPDVSAPATPSTFSAQPPSPVSTETQSADSIEVPEGVERSQLTVVAANGANVVGLAARFSDLLQDAGYVEVIALNGAVIAEGSIVYHSEGLEAVASRMAEDLGLPPAAIAPLADAPAVADLPGDTQLLAYIGRDLA